MAYDTNGNITSDGSRQIDYASFDKPSLITRQTTTLGNYQKVERIGGSGPLTEH